MRRFIYLPARSQRREPYANHSWNGREACRLRHRREWIRDRPRTGIKETLFNIIQDEVPGAYFLDLFAGSGQMGLEAVSRGARYAVFVDNGKKPAACIEENIRFTKFEHQTKLYPTEVLSALRAMEGKYQFDLIFMAPALPQGMERRFYGILQDLPF